MVMSPILVPQQNGPPMIINYPIMYPPNMLNSNLTSSSSASLPSTPSVTTSNLLNVTHLESNIRSRPPLVVETPSVPTPPPVTVVSSHIRELDQDTENSCDTVVQNAPISPIPSTSENISNGYVSMTELYFCASQNLFVRSKIVVPIFLISFVFMQKRPFEPRKVHGHDTRY